MPAAREFGRGAIGAVSCRHALPMAFDHSRVPSGCSKRRDFNIRIASVIVQLTEIVGRNGLSTFS